MISFILFLVLPLLFLFFIRKHGKTGKELLPPRPPGLPIIGNLHQIDNSAPHLSLWELSQKYGSLMSLRLGFVQTLVVSSAKMAKEVVKNHDLEFSGRPPLVGQQKLSYNGSDLAFTPYNDYWREMKKICVLQLFSSKRVQSFRSIREVEVSQMIKKISQSTPDSKVINLSEILMALTSTFITRIAFGKRYEEDGREGNRFRSLLDKAQEMLAMFFVADYFPMMGWVDKISGVRTRLEKNFKEVDMFCNEIIEDHLDPNRQIPEQEDLVDVLLRMKNEGGFTIDLTWEHIKGVITDVFIAGTDTTAASLVWAMTLLMKNPKMMTQAQEEVRNLIADKGFVDEDDIKELPYLKAVVKESMRFYPPVPVVSRETTQACNIDGYEIPAKTLVFINIWAIGRDSEAWENPEKFLPERFLGNSIDFKGQDFQLLPFGAGRRACPGINMGTSAMELALANLLYSFQWDLPNGMNKEDIDTDVVPGLTTKKKTPLYLYARTYDLVNN